MNILSIKQKIEAACKVAGISVTELGRRIGLSQSAFSQRLKRGKFTQEELQEMTEKLGVKYFSGLVFQMERK